MRVTFCAMLVGCTFLLCGNIGLAAGDVHEPGKVESALGADKAGVQRGAQKELRDWLQKIKPAAGHTDDSEFTQTPYWEQTVNRSSRRRSPLPNQE